jgi:hypothetical protein
MTMRVLVALLVLAGGTMGASAQPPTAADPVMQAPTTDQRAQALLGLGRIARARGDWARAHALFAESAALRPFDASRRAEHFWIAVECDRAAALRLATSRVAERAATADVHARRLALLQEPFEAPLLASALHDAELAYPVDVRWAAARADLALTLERRGEVEASRQAWEALPPIRREVVPAWEASYLRALARASGRAAVAPALDRYTVRHPDDAGMRALAIEAWAEARQPDRALALLAPRLGADATPTDLRRAVDLATEAGRDARARALLLQLQAHPAHTADDSWRLAEALATARDTHALHDFLRATRLDDGDCRARLVRVVTMAGSDALLADVLPDLPSSCPGYAGVARRIATVRLADADGLAAERWLAPLRDAGTLEAPDRVLLARALTARRAWAEVDAILAPLGRRGLDPEPAELLAWAWHALGRSLEAWRLVVERCAPDSATPEQQAGWAGLALAAGDDAAASRLAVSALGSPRDLEARVVLASISAQHGQPADVQRWLAPVASRLREPGHLLVWLDARAAVDGAAVALADAALIAEPGESDTEILVRRATWAATLGRVDDARAFADRVQARDADRASRLAVEMALAAGDGAAAWMHVVAASASQVAPAPAAWSRLRLDAALADGHWDEAAGALEAARGAMTEAEVVLAGARLDLGRVGRLPADTRAALDRLVVADTHVVAAQVLLARDDLAHGDAAAAVARLSGTPAGSGGHVPADVRAVQADALLALGRPDDVLGVVSADASEPPALQLARARALVALGRRDEARPALEALALRSGRPEAFVAWAGTLDSPEARIEVLQRATARATAVRADVHAALAEALLMSGRASAADVEARRALARDPQSRMAWQVTLAAQAQLDATSLRERLHEARAALGDAPRDVLFLADMAAGLSQRPAEVVEVVLAWVRDLPASHALEVARFEARLAVATADWVLAASAIATLERLTPGDPAVARLEAQVTAWRGAHEAAVPLYRAYLARAPGDVAAWREYARLLSWREDQQGAAEAYAHARTLAASPTLEAEAATRLATLQRDWDAAARAAAAWRALDPAALDPLVDLAQALEQKGDLRAAAQAYEAIERRPDLPDPVRRTLEAYRRRYAAEGRGQVRVDHAEGFGGQRLMSRRDSVLSGAASLGGAGGVRLDAQVAEGVLDTGDAATASLTEGRLGVLAPLGAGWSLSGHAGATRVEGRTQALGAVRVAMPAGARLALEGTLERRPFWENATTLAAGLQTTTGRVGLRVRGAGTLDVTAGIEAGRVSDGTRRVQVDTQVSRRFARGPQVYMVRLSGFAFGFDEARAAYFSPSAFGRVDLEAGLTRWFGPGAVVRDGRFAVQGQGGVGLDSEGEPYGLASGTLVLPVGATVSLVAGGRWTSARVYRAWTATLGLQVQPANGTSGRSGRTRQAPDAVQTR